MSVLSQSEIQALGKVGVLLGGRSAEREVSLMSGNGVLQALKDKGVDAHPFDPAERSLAELAAERFDRVFIALHGRYGEDGTVQGVLEFLRIPYTHSGELASALAMDKHQAKIMLKAAGVPVTDHVIASRAEVGRAHVMAPPYVVKPVADGSSVGILIVKADQTHPPQEILGTEWKGGETLMVERYIPGRELTCAVMGDVALGVTEIVTDLAFYNYEAKYSDGGSRHIVPAELKPKIYDKVQKMAMKAHAALGCRGVTRTDFRYNDRAGEDGELVCLEINTQPGMTPTSLAPEQALHAGHSFEELVTWMVEDASCNR